MKTIGIHETLSALSITTRQTELSTQPGGEDISRTSVAVVVSTFTLTVEAIVGTRQPPRRDQATTPANQITPAAIEAAWAGLHKAM